MNLKAMAVEIIARHGKEDVDFLTFSEAIYEELTGEGLEIEELKITESEIDLLTQELATLVNSAEVVISWSGDEEEYSI